MTQLYALLGLLALLIGGWGLWTWFGWAAGKNEAKLTADESTLRQVGVGNDVARKIDGLPDGAAGNELRKHWSR